MSHSRVKWQFWPGLVWFGSGLVSVWSCLIDLVLLSFSVVLILVLLLVLNPVLVLVLNQVLVLVLILVRVCPSFFLV